MTTQLVPPKNVPIPKNADELAEMVGDPGKLKPIIENKEAFAGFIQAYADQQQAPGTDLHEAIKAETQKQLADYLREKDLDGDNVERINRLNLDPQGGARNRKGGMLTSYGQGANHNPNAPGVVLDDKFNNAVDYLESIWHLNESPEASARRTEIRNAASSVSPADGGFLVPETLRSQLLQVSLETATVRPRATVVPMDSARVPFPTIDVSSNQSSVFGGMIAYWGEESAALVDANPKFGRVVLDAKKLTGLSVVPNELLQDSIISFSALIERLWPMTLSFEEDAAFSKGNGVGQPLGYLGNPATVAVGAESGQAADTIVYENIVKMYARMLPSSLQRAAWVVTPDALPELLTMSLSVGTGGNSVFVANAAGAAPMTIFGRPIIVTEQASVLGDQGDIAFVDLTYYLVGDRQTMTASSSTDWKFGNDQTAYRIIQRVDGRPWIQSAITPKNGGPALSPFVELAARA
ncbi:MULTISPECIES: phage major capsid protein [Amycolatopsis]|uniref:phage major capsid protein n=1 Tax=Amycolatopsis TaxID=1813 RepID=UPI00041DCED1|nr:phage major capsid protein [Amycolatopsis thermoflava]